MSPRLSRVCPAPSGASPPAVDYQGTRFPAEGPPMRRPLALAAALLALGTLAPPLRAGLHYSGEAFADLPSRWGGFLLDQRLLRTLAAKPSGGVPAANPAR